VSQLGSMNDVYLWAVTAITAAVALTTLYRLWMDRERLSRDDLHDEDRLFAWRIVLFLIYPLLTLIDLRSTLIACQALGGYVSSWSYGMFWYTAFPQALGNQQLLLVLFTGAIVQIILALMLVPALLFRPHPFLSTVVGYAIVGILGLNLFVDPVLSCFGMGSSRWHLAMMVATSAEKAVLFGIYGLLSLVFFLTVNSRRTRVWFAQLSRPLVAEQLTTAQVQWKVDPHNAANNARLSILYERAGLRRHAIAHWKRLHSMEPRSIYSAFVEAMLAYKQRKYKVARQQFIFASDCPGNDPLLRGALLAAAACSAFADQDMEGALNLCERALEFDDASVVARMVKVDVFLHTGKKQQAGQEIISALKRGCNMELEGKIPLDAEFVLQRINRIQARERGRRAVGSRS
jgi:tetratricopeptide (TPR) repeat protein